MDGTIDAVQSTLAAIETSRPAMFVDKPDSGGSDQQPARQASAARAGPRGHRLHVENAAMNLRQPSSRAAIALGWRLALVLGAAALLADALSITSDDLRPPVRASASPGHARRERLAAALQSAVRDYPAVASHPLFHPTRLPWVPPLAPEPEAPAAPVSPLLDYTLIGVVASGDQRTALLRLARRGPHDQPERGPGARGLDAARGDARPPALRQRRGDLRDAAGEAVGEPAMTWSIRRRTGLAAATLAVAMLTGCNDVPRQEAPGAIPGITQVTSQSLTPPRPTNYASDQPISLTGSGASARPVGAAEVVMGTGQFVSPGAAAAGAGTPVLSGSDVTLDFANVDVRDVLKAVLGDLLQLPYVIDPGVQGNHHPADRPSDPALGGDRRDDQFAAAQRHRARAARRHLPRGADRQRRAPGAARRHDRLRHARGDAAVHRCHRPRTRAGTRAAAGHHAAGRRRAQPAADHRLRARREHHHQQHRRVRRRLPARPVLRAAAAAQRPRAPGRRRCEQHARDLGPLDRRRGQDHADRADERGPRHLDAAGLPAARARLGRAPRPRRRPRRHAVVRLSPAERPRDRGRPRAAPRPRPCPTSTTAIAGPPRRAAAGRVRPSGSGGGPSGVIESVLGRNANAPPSASAPRHVLRFGQPAGRRRCGIDPDRRRGGRPHPRHPRDRRSDQQRADRHRNRPGLCPRRGGDPETRHHAAAGADRGDGPPK